ncbi:proteophosphoglycan ppg4 [Pyrrhoderma noxium]|uniref:Proteophosphoglycan ppg4 n=1 Tax=Pyrrhoderma noxium TaxID=2282107 RepID=A0A286UV73_9AGAM|nr:proteophosphoglycan ppg4 [Pyrrhoderma noxium]
MIMCPPTLPYPVHLCTFYQQSMPIEDTMDVIIIRPKRDPTIVQDTNSEGDRRRFAGKTMHVLHAAYKDGAHIDLGYLEDGSLHDYYTKDCVRGVIEYLRCGGWEWKVEEDTTHFCADGTMFEIEAGSKIECTTTQIKNLHFYVVT